MQKKNPSSAAAAASALRDSKIIIIPTDTIYGFSGLFGKTADAIAQIKGREEHKPFIALIAEPSDIYHYTDAVVPNYLVQLWPAPLTLIVPTKDSKTQAFRCPADPWLRKLIAEAGEAIYSTSVNHSGMPPLTDIDSICAEFEESVALIVDGGEQAGLPSTIIDVCSAVPKILRQGALSVNIQ